MVLPDAMTPTTSPPVRPLPIITLLTDFGLSDSYVGAMKGAILSVNPNTVIIDINHDVRPQQVEQAAFLAASAWPYFPPGCVHIAVVDPGVGGDRRAVVLGTPRGYFVGPDNGVLSAALPARARRAGLSALPPGYRAVAITGARYLRQPVSSTFHGRDVFGPVAARLTLGVPLESLGGPLASLVSLPPFRARRRSDGSLRGRVLHVDRFGNLVTNVRARDVARRIIVEVAGETIAGVLRTYGEGEGLVALVGSSGYLEIALSGGSAAETLGAGPGTPVIARRAGAGLRECRER